MTLQEKLDSIAAASATKIPAETREIMHRETQALIDSGQAARPPRRRRPGTASPR